MAKKHEVKKYSLTEEEKSEYFFYFRLMKEWQEMAEYWQNKLNWVRVAAIKRNALNPDKVKTSWDSTLENGTFTAEPTMDSNKE